MQETLLNLGNSDFFSLGKRSCQSFITQDSIDTKHLKQLLLKKKQEKFSMGGSTNGVDIKNGSLDVKMEVENDIVGFNMETIFSQTPDVVKKFKSTSGNLRAGSSKKRKLDKLKAISVKPEDYNHGTGELTEINKKLNKNLAANLQEFETTFSKLQRAFYYFVSVEDGSSESSSRNFSNKYSFDSLDITNNKEYRMVDVNKNQSTPNPTSLTKNKKDCSKESTNSTSKRQSRKKGSSKNLSRRKVKIEENFTIGGGLKKKIRCGKRSMDVPHDRHHGSEQKNQKGKSFDVPTNTNLIISNSYPSGDNGNKSVFWNFLNDSDDDKISSENKQIFDFLQDFDYMATERPHSPPNMLEFFTKDSPSKLSSANHDDQDIGDDDALWGADNSNQNYNTTNIGCGNNFSPLVNNSLSNERQFGYISEDEVD